MDGKSILCANHKHAVKFYCLKHDFPCCARCVATQHKTCVDILSEEDLCNVKHSAEADEHNEAVYDLRQNIELFKRSVSDILSILDEQKSDRLNEIQLFKTRLERQLNQLVEKIDNEIADRCDNMKREINTDKKKFKQVNDILERIDGAMRGETVSGMQYLLTMKENIKLVKKARRHLESLASQTWLNNVSLDFSPNLALLDVLSKESIGKVSLTKERSPIILRPPSNRNAAQVILTQNEREENIIYKNKETGIDEQDNKLTKFLKFFSPFKKEDSTSNSRKIVLDKRLNSLIIHERNGIVRLIQLHFKAKEIYEIMDNEVKVTYGRPLKYTTVDISERKEDIHVSSHRFLYFALLLYMLIRFIVDLRSSDIFL